MAAIFTEAQDDKATAQQVAVAILTGLKGMAPYATNVPDLKADCAAAEHARLELIDEFEVLADDADLDFDTLDESLDRLYSWGDTRIGGRGSVRACWIKTI